MTEPPVIDYEGSDYQASFWEHGGRGYEDRAEELALKRLLPKSGNLLLEVGAGAGRNTPRYSGFARVVLVDYSLSQLAQARDRLGESGRYIYVAANAYHLPFVDSLFDAATMIRALHHMADAPRALGQVRSVLPPNGVFILEFANKRNLKSILRYILRLQIWNPFSLEPVEFAKLNFDFHPAAVRGWLEDLGFAIEKSLAVSHFRIAFVKKIIPARLLANLDALFQPLGGFWQYTPSIFIRSRLAAPHLERTPQPEDPALFFKCPACGQSPLIVKPAQLDCPACARTWRIENGIYDFRFAE